MGNCFGGGAAEKQPLLKKIGGHKKNEGGGIFQEDIEGEAWTDVPKRSCVILPGSTYACPWDVILWRMALCAAMACITAWSIIAHMHGINDDNEHETIKNTDIKFWFIYLTHWALMAETLYFFMALVTLLMAVCSQDPERKRQDNPKPWYMTLTWGLQSICLPMSLLVAILFWTLEYDPKQGKPQLLSVATHGGNFVLMLVDFVLGQQPLFFMKIMWPISFVGAYFIFSYSYYANGGVTEAGQKNIYESIDWGNPGGVATVLGIIFGALIAAWLVIYGVYRFIKHYCGPPPLKG